jgi:selenide,water dikinase
LDVGRSILEGAATILTEAGASLVGGHTLDDPQLKFGLLVLGVVQQGQVLSNQDARPGDTLILTKPLGTGLTINAAKAELATEVHIQAANRWMGTLNAAAARAALASGARAATDITGFGLLGHAWQMAVASNVGLVFDSENLPLLDGALEWASMGLVPAGAFANRSYLENRVKFSDRVGLPLQDVMFDPQTSGGLLICLPPGGAEVFQKSLGEIEGCCVIIGRVRAAEGEPRVIVE